MLFWDSEPNGLHYVNFKHISTTQFTGEFQRTRRLRNQAKRTFFTPIQKKAVLF